MATSVEALVVVNFDLPRLHLPDSSSICSQDFTEQDLMLLDTFDQVFVPGLTSPALVWLVSAWEKATSYILSAVEPRSQRWNSWISVPRLNVDEFAFKISHADFEYTILFSWREFINRSWRGRSVPPFVFQTNGKFLLTMVIDVDLLYRRWSITSSDDHCLLYSRLKLVSLAKLKCGELERIITCIYFPCLIVECLSHTPSIVRGIASIHQSCTILRRGAVG